MYKNEFILSDRELKSRNVHPSIPPPDLVRKVGNDEEYKRSDTSLHEHPDVEIIQSSEGLGWMNLYAALTRERPHIADRRAIPDVWFATTLSGINFQRMIGGQKLHGIFPQGLVTITPGNMAVRDEIAEPINALHVYLRAAVLEEVADDLFVRDPLGRAVIPNLAARDEILYSLLQAIRFSLYDFPYGSRLKDEHLSRALAAHILQRHSADGPAAIVNRAPGGFGVKQLRRVLDYIKENLGNEISVKEMAAVAGVSRVSFIRRFKASMAMTPYHYVMLARINYAKTLLHDHTMTLAQIGLVCGFSNQAHFSSVFKRLVGTTPSEYRLSKK